MPNKPISKQTLARLPLYLNYLKSYLNSGQDTVSATCIAETLGLNQVQVRKDLACVSCGGRPKVGYVTNRLIDDIELFLGYGDVHSAVIVGAGKLGQALISYDQFKSYGLEIVAAFDTDAAIIGKQIGGKEVISAEKIQHLCRRMQVKIGIITVPASAAQQVCDALIAGGILAVWNFAPVHLNVPEGILVQQENMALSLAVLSKHLNNQLASAHVNQSV